MICLFTPWMISDFDESFDLSCFELFVNSLAVGDVDFSFGISLVRFSVVLGDLVLNRVYGVVNFLGYIL